jgi:iron complex transport system ATP-binding protein
LLLDEPTTFLDMAHQIEVLHLLDDLNRRAGRTIVMILHDLNHAARYADHLIAMAAGRIVSQGSPQEVVTPAMLRDVFGVEAEIIADPRTGVPLCIPYGLHISVRATAHHESSDSHVRRAAALQYTERAASI